MSQAVRPEAPALGQEYRVEGRAKVTGRARYAADVRLEGALWLAYTRSTIPHGIVRGIETRAARELPGVRGIITGEDIRPARMGRRLLDWPVLAWDRVRFIGDRVAAVAADTRDAARRAADLIDVEYEELPAVVDFTRALAPDAPLVHDEASDYRYLGGTRPPRSHPNVQGVATIRRGGDIDAAFAKAPHVFEHEFTAPRQYQGHVEPHGCVVWLDGGRVRVISTNKTPYRLREQLAETLGIDEATIEVANEFIGGDFGAKGMSLDEFTCYYLARATGRPVRAFMDMADEFQAANPRHSARLRLRTAVDHDGRFIAHRSRILFDGGAYAAAKPSATLTPAGGLSTLGCYVVPNVDHEVVTVYTNTVPGGHMRGPGETQALFASESHVDLIAEALHVDPIEFRLRNVVRDGEAGPNGVAYERPRAVEVLTALADASDWRKPLPAGRGRGVSLSVRRPGGGKSAVILGVRPGGLFEVVTGASDQGGGAHTAIRRVAARTLSVAEDRVAVRFGSTGEAPVDAGAGGSRLTYLTSRAVENAALRMKAQLEAVFAERRRLATDDVELRDGRFVIRGRGDARPSFVSLEDGIQDSALADVEGAFDSSKGTDREAAPSFIGYVAEVTVDSETGQLVVDATTLVADVGTVINPVAHEGQLRGGFVFGLGSALMEELIIDQGQVTTAGLNDYKLPTSMDIPPLRIVLLPPDQGSGALGAKMVGELANGAVAAAIANATAAATGIRLHTFPITSERILAAIQARGATGTSERRRAPSGG